MITVRRARQDDLPLIVTMVQHFIEGTPYQRFLNFNPHAMEALTERCIEAGLVFVAELEDGSLAGFIAGVYGAEPIAHTKMLDELAWWIEPVYRNGRLGPKLLRAFERWAQEQGLEAVTMKAPHGSDVGRFYTRCGYVPVETIYFKRVT